MSITYVDAFKKMLLSHTVLSVSQIGIFLELSAFLPDFRGGGKKYGSFNLGYSLGGALSSISILILCGTLTAYLNAKQALRRSKISGGQQGSDPQLSSSRQKKTNLSIPSGSKKASP
jgi:hypothetical protein